MDNVMLIVDDIEMNREILKALFQSEYEIMEAEGGVEALEILKACRGNIDIMLLDLIMPEMSGFDVLEQRNELEYLNNVPIVVITSSGAMEDQIRAFELGANDFVAKPFVPEIVVSRVNNVMASNRRMQSIKLEAQKLKLKSELDTMTGLYNKTTTEYAMGEILSQSEGRMNVLMVIDIDNFKSVNDTSGHLAGDHVIKIIADLVSGLFRKTDIVGRIGGDEFCALMVGIPSMNIAYDKVNELIQIMRYKPNLTIPEYVTLSIGIASNEKKSISYGELFHRADEALYLAKEGGKAQYREYGVEVVNVDSDERPVIVLISNNRSVCSVIHSLLPAQVRVVEALELKDLYKFNEADKSKIALVYVDVSEQKQGTKEYFDKLKQLEWLPFKRMVAICKESLVTQYMDALNSGVADMITAPIDATAFKRRMMNLLEKR